MVDTVGKSETKYILTVPLVDAGLASLPAVRPSTAVAVQMATNTYRALSTTFTRNTEELGPIGGKEVAIWKPGVGGYLLTVPLTSGIAAGVVAGTAAAIFSGPLLAAAGIAGGVTAFVAMMGGPVFHDVLLKTIDRRIAKLTEKRATTPLAAHRIAFAREAYDAAQPVERVHIGELAKQWLKELDQRQVIGKEARDILRGVVRDSESIDAQVKEKSARLWVVSQALYSKEGTTRDFTDHYAVNALLAALAALTPDEHAEVLPSVRDALFTGETPRVKMSFNACQALLEGLQPRGVEAR